MKDAAEFEEADEVSGAASCWLRLQCGLDQRHLGDTEQGDGCAEQVEDDELGLLPGERVVDSEAKRGKHREANQGYRRCEHEGAHGSARLRVDAADRVTHQRGEKHGGSERPDCCLPRDQKRPESKRGQHRPGFGAESSDPEHAKPDPCADQGKSDQPRQLQLLPPQPGRKPRLACRGEQASLALRSHGLLSRVPRVRRRSLRCAASSRRR